MSKTLIGSLFILAGALYGSLAIDNIYNHTLGWLVEHNWVKRAPILGKDDLKTIFSRKPAILFYSGVLIFVGIFILWNRNS